MLAWAIGKGKVNIWCPHKENMPYNLRAALEDRKNTKVAWNAGFEHGVLSQLLGIEVPWDDFLDPMVWARHMSLPGKLEDCGTALNLPEDQAKMKEGKRLIQFFCSPYREGGEVWLFGVAPPEFHDWDTHPREWAVFEDYCKQDVEAERNILDIIPTPLPQREQELWVLDQIINERGIPTNRKFVKNALAMAQRCKDDLLLDLSSRTDLSNPNSPKQLLPWLKSNGYPHNSLNKKFVEAALKNPKLPKIAADVLLLRQDTSKTAYSKLERILDIINDNDRLCGQFMFMGASRSGRWSGSGVQVHNLPRPIKWVEKHLDEAISFVDAFDYAGLTAMLAMEKKPPSIISVMTSLIRSAFQAPEGKILSVCDLNAIENRVLGYVTNCQPILNVFTTMSPAGRAMCPYLSFAALMYNIPYAVLEKAYYEDESADAKEKRQVSKPVVLGAGYGLGAGVDRICTKCSQDKKYNREVNDKLGYRDEVCKKHPRHPVQYVAQIDTDSYGNEIKKGLMGYADNMGVSLTPEQCYFAWKAFRDAYPEVVQGWDDLQAAAIEVLENGNEVTACYVTFDRIEQANGQFIMRIKLPSGRYLHYMNARIKLEEKVSDKGRRYVSKSLMYDGIGHGVGAIGAGWGPVYTYGGKLMENVVQAIARDVLADSMMLAHKMGAEIVLHVHDEIGTIANAADAFAFRLKDLHFCMSKTPFWAPGLPLGAAGFEGKYYKK